MKNIRPIITLGILLIILVGLLFLLPQETATPFSHWKTYTNDRYGFSIQYPPDLAIYATEITPGNFEKEGVVLHLGPPDYIHAVQTVAETEGPAEYLVVSADVPVDPTNETGCLDGTASDRVSIDGVETDLCLRPSIFSEQSLWISVTRDSQTFFRFSSDQYEGKEKTKIDQMISTFRFTK